MNASVQQPTVRRWVSGGLAVVAVSSAFVAGASGQGSAEVDRPGSFAEAGRPAAEQVRDAESAAVGSTQTGRREGSSDRPPGLEEHRYLCDSGAVLISAYDPEKDTMWVDYRGQVLALNRLRSGSGAKFGGTDVPWGWWNKGAEGIVFGNADDGSDAEVLDSCQAEAVSGTRVERDPPRQWSLELHSDYIALLDCMDCGDDIGAVLECRGQGKPARLSIFWAAVDSDDALDAALTLEAGGEVFERSAETTYAGQIGQFPQIRIGPDDPLIAALEAGSEMQVSFANVETSIGLNGFESAFAEFDRACPWHRDRGDSESEQDFGAGSNQAGGCADAASDGPCWMFTEYTEADSGASMASLSFGIPETDAIAFQATCAPGDQKPAIDAVALLDVHERIDAAPAELLIATDDLELRLAGQVSKGHDTYPGILVSVGPRHPLWAILESNDPVSLAGGDGPGVSLPATGSSKVIAEFLRSCAEQ